MESAALPTEPRAESSKIERLRERANDLRDSWLRSRGWSHTSETPGCYWMWQREWKGKTFLVDTTTAERIQATWDGEEDFKQHPERYED